MSKHKGSNIDTIINILSKTILPILVSYTMKHKKIRGIGINQIMTKYKPQLTQILKLSLGKIFKNYKGKGLHLAGQRHIGKGLHLAGHI